MIDKQLIRDHYLKKRLALSPSEYDSLSQKLSSSFFSSVELFEVNVIHLFLSIAKKNEPNTWLIIDRLKKDFPGIRISIPKINKENELIHFYLENENQIKENHWGIPEPVFGEKTPIEKIDMVIVPLLAFDKEGNRVGYGKGYYDRFLSHCRSDCKKVGLSFFEPIDETLDVNQFDIKLNAVTTPKGFFSFA